MTSTDENTILGALRIFIYTNDLLCYPTLYDLDLMRINYTKVVGVWAFCNLFLSEYLSNIKNIKLMLDMERCNTRHEQYLHTHSFSIIVNKDLNLQFYTNITDVYLRNSIEVNEDKIIIAPVAVTYSWGGQHETALIFDPSRKTIEYFDPMYDFTDFSKQLYKKINEFLLNIIGKYIEGWSWHNMESLGAHPGWQTMSEPYRGSDATLEREYIGGYCVSWCILYAILKSIVSYAPVNNTGELILRIFPIAASISGSYDMGLAMHIIIRNFALELILSLFEKDQSQNFLGNLLQDSQTWERNEPKEDSCGIDRITHATQEIIKQLRKENVRNNKPIASRTRAKNVFPPTHYLQPNIVSEPKLFNTNPFTNPKRSYDDERLAYLVGMFDIKRKDDLRSAWYELSPDKKQLFNNFLVQKGYEPLPLHGFLV